MLTASPRSLRDPFPPPPESIFEVARPFFFPGLKSVLDPSFLYVPAAATDVARTWQRYGFSARANAERRARLQSTAEMQSKASEISQLRELFRRVAAARQAA